MKTAAKQYSDVNQNNKNHFTVTGVDMTVNNLITMSTNWRISGVYKKTGTANNSYDGEQPAIALSAPGAFTNWKCIKCSEPGHMAWSCTKPG